MEPTDESLLDRYFTGDAQAFNDFFSRHSGRVVGYGRRKGLNDQDAFELAQEVFLRLHQVIHKYESGRPALPWFFTIVHRMALDRLRKVKTTEMRFINDEDQIARTASGKELEETVEISDEAMAGLSSDQRRIVELRVTRDLSFKEIALEVGKSEQTARKFFERAIKFLKKQIVEQDNNHE